MADGFAAELQGIDEMRRRLDQVPATLRKKVLLKALRNGAQIISRDAKARAPVLVKPAPFRKPGTVRKAISVRASKLARQAGDVGVFVGVKALRGARQKKLGKAGAKNPNDPYYWRFLEFDTKRGPGRKFLTNAANTKAGAALDAAIAEVVPAIEKMDRR
ncbi:MAG: HK97 gp10 family phage protein [Rhodocyclaceae bacterium]|nr:HK97 gp10 family phage protein [Rhodocyclaceae bacterium]